MIGVIPETPEEALKNYDAGEPVFTVEMGGIGPGYEQIIYIATFEMMRQLIGKELPKDGSALNKFLDNILDRINEGMGLQMSGAQAGASKNLAYHFVNDGYKKTMESVSKDRHIQVDNHWKLK
jgi:hypothetical protein